VRTVRVVHRCVGVPDVPGIQIGDAHGAPCACAARPTPRP
jgi:hypothetical protein